MHEDRSELEAVLERANESIRMEIIRQAEVYMSAQLAAGIAADQRATTFAGILAAALAVLGGGAIAMGSGGGTSVVWAAMSVPAIVGFLWAIRLAIVASEPVDWFYVGNCPSAWLKDLQVGKTISKSLAEQACHYANGIESSNVTLGRQARHMKSAIKSAWVGLLGSAILSSLFLCFPSVVMYLTEHLQRSG